MEEIPGVIALMGSGETSGNGGQVFESLAKRLEKKPVISVVETPAGFELNSERVAKRVADFINRRLQNYRPEVFTVPARKLNFPNSTNDPNYGRIIAQSNLVFMGPGSPSYAVRQLKDSLIWNMIKANHRAGGFLAFSSAATVAIGKFALPIYEIYKVGEDPHWKPGLDLLGCFGLALVIVPHWNNREGGADLDTSRCYIGRARFEPLAERLEETITILGLDEHTSVILDFQHSRCKVYGRGVVHIQAGKENLEFTSSDTFSLTTLGKVSIPEKSNMDIPAPVWELFEDTQKEIKTSQQPAIPPARVGRLIQQREVARAQKDWRRADSLRQEIMNQGWQIDDTPAGPFASPKEID